VHPDASSQQPAPSPERPAPTLVPRIVAVIEVLLCSDYPTQLALGASFTAFGYGPFTSAGQLRLGYVVGLSIADSLLLIGLVLLFLVAHGESPADVLNGRRNVLREIAAGVPMTLVALAIGMAVLGTIQLLAPTLHTVEHNPLQQLLRSPGSVALFVCVVIVAGGVREEVQRAFLLHRFDQWLGGGRVGVVVTSIAFGSGHLLQCVDAAIATGLLGAFWGVIYLRRRSMVAPMVSHAGFDLLQIVQFLVVGK
jgi:uncharacterized protein